MVYCLYPDLVLPKLFNIKVETIHLTNIFRALMGAYLAVSALWVAGIFKREYWIIATVTNVVFMEGLAFGRLLSLVLDGIPSLFLLAGLFADLFFAFWGMKNIKKYQHLSSFNKPEQQKFYV